MADLTLWHVPQSRSMRSLWLLHEIGADFRVETLDFFDGSMRQPPYAAITPVGRVPALQDGAVTLHESGAITEWLCETRAPHLTSTPGTSAAISFLFAARAGRSERPAAISSAPTKPRRARLRSSAAIQIS